MKQIISPMRALRIPHEKSSKAWFQLGNAKDVPENASLNFSTSASAPF
jgi:hypothetical protein